jgi:sucrose-6F-phosphate phosphohydrolase
VQSIGEAFTELRLQPSDFISHHKVSFYGTDLDESFFERLRGELEHGRQQTSIIYSSNRDLDILPAESNKGAAAIYLARYWKISPEKTLIAGDSGNDAEMFRSGFRGIVVGNAAPELKSLDSPTIYSAEGHYAAGVLEGIRHWQSKWVDAEYTTARQWN